LTAGPAALLLRRRGRDWSDEQHSDQERRTTESHETSQPAV